MKETFNKNRNEQEFMKKLSFILVLILALIALSCWRSRAASVGSSEIDTVSSGPPKAVATNFLCVSVTGSDTFGKRNSYAQPFKTLGAARTNSVSGDTVLVLPGNYTNRVNILKNGVDWYFYDGAVVHQNATNSTHLLFGDGYQDASQNAPGTGGNAASLSITSSISGRGVFWLETVSGTAEGDSPYGLIQFWNSNTVMHVEAKSIGMRGSATLDSWAIAVRDCRHVFVKTDQVLTGGDGSGGDSGGGGLLWLNGNMELEAGRMISEAGCPVYGEQDAGTRGYSDCYVNAEVIGSTNNAAVWCYNNGGTNSLWVKANEIYTGDYSAVWMQGIKLYIEAEKISNRPTVADNLIRPCIYVDGGPTYSEQLWVTAQKVSGSGVLFDANSSSAHSTNILNVMNWEGLAGCTNAVRHESSSGKTWILSQLASVATAANNSFAIFDGGQLTLQGVTVNAPTGVRVSASGLSVKGCTFLATDAASITAAAPQTVGTYWSAATVTTNGNITFTPNAGWTVSASAK